MFVIGADCRFCVLLVGLAARNNEKNGAFSAEDQEINSAGWNWAGVASIWGVAGTENWWSLRLERFQQALPFISKRYQKIKHPVDWLVRIFLGYKY